jgi:hypothetical protein
LRQRSSDVKRHVFAGQSWFGERMRECLQRFREAGISVGVYDPLTAGDAVTDGGGTPPNEGIQPTR